tara:strand:- start:10956 stop:11210 length:255 start_codon:yes stop_codon:yes gene_type:complete
VARLSSAKAATAVRIRFGPPEKTSSNKLLGVFYQKNPTKIGSVAKEIQKTQPERSKQVVRVVFSENLHNGTGTSVRTTRIVIHH